jgi:tol-pal system protein YbgF
MRFLRGHVGDALTAALVAGVMGGACAHAQPSAVAIAELNRTVASLRVQNASYERQIEELQNRVFILDDSRKAAASPGAASAPRALPTVTLRPSDRASVAPGPAEPPDEPSEPSVEYVGEAATSSARRPLLRLYGDETPVFSHQNDDQAAAAPARRLSVAGEGTTLAGKAGGPAARPAAKARGPAELYQRAREALQGGRHQEAMAGFREFLRLYPGHDFADNAQYWLAESHYDQKDYPTALREFRRVVDRYPQGNKVPDALLKLAYCHLALGSTEVGRRTLEQVARSYPGHGAAALASARLAEEGQHATASRASSEERP